MLSSQSGHLGPGTGDLARSMACCLGPGPSSDNLPRSVVIPLFDVIPRRHRPYVTLSLMAAYVLAYLLQRATLGMPEALFDFGVIPARARWTTFVTAQFVHASLVHVALNVLFLWLFGPTVEDRTGHGRFLAFYALAALASTLAYATVHAQSMLPVVGTTGAVAAVLGAYLALYHRSLVLILIPIPGLPIVELPVLLIAGMWVAVQALAGSMTVTLAGLAIGAPSILLFRRRERMQIAWWN
jgi:membrane associated rhomboid family serine protease